ncbi:hypothetical protein CEXT_158981 [Caerostris extrusa]|uniref:Uncharacterized protein n=1 Tax=Caerostris extrusa TaxID=172846 RepID=A0AAV4XP68_CAEEX|nr:hypothetical protein CEXT_158981 [Caerostris extrusa]
MGRDNTIMLYPKLLLRLPDLRELNDYPLLDYNLRLGTGSATDSTETVFAEDRFMFSRSEKTSVVLAIQKGTTDPWIRVGLQTSSEVSSARVPWSLVRDVLRLQHRLFLRRRVQF